MTGAGDLQERLRFESPSPVDDGAGNYSEGWTSEFTVWAGVKPLRGGEGVIAARLAGTQPVIITVRRSTQSRDIRPEWRAVDVRSGAVYQLKAPPADMQGTRMYLDFLAESGVAA